MEKLDGSIPTIMFNGKDDLYQLVRETRTFCNELKETVESLKLRVEALELLLSDTQIVDEDAMANTQGNPSMRSNVISKKRKQK